MKKNIILILAFLMFITPNFYSLAASNNYPPYPPSDINSYYAIVNSGYGHASPRLYTSSSEFHFTKIWSSNVNVLTNVDSSNFKTYNLVEGKWVVGSDSSSIMIYSSSNIDYSSHDILDKVNGGTFFGKKLVPQVVLSQMVSQVEMGAVMITILTLVGSVVSLIVLSVGLRKSWKWLLAQLQLS